MKMANRLMLRTFHLFVSAINEINNEGEVPAEVGMSASSAVRHSHHEERGARNIAVKWPFPAPPVKHLGGAPDNVGVARSVQWP